MISSNDFKKGMAIKINSDIFTIVDFQHVKPGKGAAFVRSKLKSLTKGTVLDKTFRAGEKVEDIRVEKRGMQYSYDEGDSLVFMDTETYDEFRVNKDIIGNLLDYIKEGDTVEISVYDEKPISIDPPIFVELLVTYAEPGVRGDTATNVNKPVTVETGAQIHVPIFVNQDDIIKIDTRTGEYVERVKK
ncbi:MAG: elongation factor P [Spirochaetes bacterium]|nr:elongation factor P [Spirochaetota bacterium]MBN2769636.1 elongation factor P [Spirochaetota bacterium]